MTWETVIGLEIHVQLATQAKIFSTAPTSFGAPANRQACAVDIALPGTLPSFNEAALKHAIRFGLAVNATINRRSLFARKHYFYPDLPKGYQISQYELPIVEHGHVDIFNHGRRKTIHITRAHLEEDAGKSLHEDFHGMSGIDLNRAGIALLEVVSAPEISSADEAVAYAKTLHGLVCWIDICDGNMQEGSFRIDANVSVRRCGDTRLGVRCEIKNLNSFRFLEKAIDYEVQRQIALLEEGAQVVQQTRLYDVQRQKTRAMRSKEDAHDYRYFPDPDLPPLEVSPSLIDAVRASLPELPGAMAMRFIQAYQLSEYDAYQLCHDYATATYFEACVAAGGQAKLVVNWMMGELTAILKQHGLSFQHCPLRPQRLAALLLRIQDKTLSNALAKQVFAQMWANDEEADTIIAAQNLAQLSDDQAISALIKRVLAEHAAMVDEYRCGKKKAFNALVGQVMKASAGRANPAQVSQQLKQFLEQ